MTKHDNFADWIGRESEPRADSITPRLIAEYEATLGGALFRADKNDIAPLGAHWCLAPDIVPQDAIGVDGHPKKGKYIPPVPLPRRMWAGGALTFHKPLAVGDVVEKRSSIASLDWKQGRSGQLCFITIKHGYTVAGSLAIDETQHVVYREAATAPPPPVKATTPPALAHKSSFAIDPVVLFRFSAMTFNGHRIHYDLPYAREAEFYPDLVAHGPLQAVLLLNFAAKTKGQPPKRFSYRGVAPAIGAQNLTIGGNANGDGLELMVVDAKGITTMTGAAEW